MTETYTDRYSSERIEPKAAILEISFFDGSLDYISDEKLSYEFFEDAGKIRVICQEPSAKVKFRLEAEYWKEDIQGCIEDETGFKISKIDFVTK